MRNGGAVHKNIEAVQSINRAMPEGLRMAGFPFEVSKHRSLGRE